MARNSPQPRSSEEWLQSIETHFVAENTIPHIDFSDRIRLWKAMDIEHGFGESECRRAVLAARHTWPLIDDCEKTLLENFNTLPDWIDYRLIRNILKISTEIYLQKRSPLDLSNVHQYQCTLDSLSDCMSLKGLEPVSLTPLAILKTSLLLLHAKHDVVDQSECEFWQEVLENGYSDLEIDSCDWEDRDTFHWVFWVHMGDVAKNDKKEMRITFWREWLKDVVEVNTRPLTVLNSAIRHWIQ